MDQLRHHSHKINIVILAIIGSVFFGELVYLRSAPPTNPVQAQIRGVKKLRQQLPSTCDPVACATIGGECARNRAECDKNGMIPISCDVTTNPQTGQKTCQLLGGKSPNDPVCCKNIWGWRELGKDSCNGFTSKDECNGIANIVHSCCWYDAGIPPDQCVSTARTDEGGRSLCAIPQPTAVSNNPANIMCNGNCHGTRQNECQTGFCQVLIGTGEGVCRNPNCPNIPGCICPTPSSQNQTVPKPVITSESQKIQLGSPNIINQQGQPL